MQNFFELSETIELLKIFGKVFILSWFITRFEPLQWFISKLFLIEFSEKFNKLNKIKNELKFLLETLTTCMKCTSFWLALILTQDIYLSSISSFIGMLYEKTIGKWETKIKFK
jgi:hypothetical protein